SRPRNLSWRPDCARSRDQSIPFAGHPLSCLLPLLDGRDLAGGRIAHFALAFANSVSRIAPDLERRSRLATRYVALRARWDRATASTRLQLEKSIDFRRGQSFAPASQRRGRTQSADLRKSGRSRFHH